MAVQVRGEHGRKVAALWLRGAVFTLVAPITLGVFIPRLFERQRPGIGVLQSAGWLAVPAGAALYGFCLVQFLLSGGTPAIFFTHPMSPRIGREPTTLVDRGLYGVTRNPMYVGVVLAVVGQALLYRSAAVAIYAALLWTCFHLMVVMAEESHLRAQYGDPYVRYCGAVPRWLW